MFISSKNTLTRNCYHMHSLSRDTDCSAMMYISLLLVILMVMSYAYRVEFILTSPQTSSI